MAAGEAQRFLLSAADPPPVRVTNREGKALFLLLGDHAGNCVPAGLDGLGLSPDDLQRHIALDIGVSALGKALSAMLDAPFVEQRYSRLVVDCNRAMHAVDSIAHESDGTPIPLNASASSDDRMLRYVEVFAPYHREIEALLRERKARNADTILVSLHSFTPEMAGVRRPWDIGVLHDRGSTAFATTMLQDLQSAEQWIIGNNQPYRMDGTDFTVPHHAYPRRLLYVELEVRHDRLRSADGIAAMANVLAAALTRAASRLSR